MTPEQLEQFKEIIAGVVNEKFAELSGTGSDTNLIATPQQSFDEVYNYIPRTIEGGYVYTKSGSILNMQNKRSPWIKVSDETRNWALAFMKRAKEQTLTAEEHKTLQTADDASGGYLVPEDFSASVIMYEAPGVAVWSRATVWPMGTNNLSVPKLAQSPTGTVDHFAGVSFAWTDEGGTKSETEPEFEFLELVAHELSGYTAITDTLIDDSAINLMNFLTRIFANAYQWQTDKVFITGDGAKKPLGIIEDPQVTTVSRTTASTVTVADVLEMESELPAQFDNGACWFLNKKVRKALRGQTDDNGALLLKEYYNDLSAGYQATLLGYPVVMTDNKTSAIGTKGDVIFGNWTWYYIGARQNYTMDVSRHFLFRSNKTAVRMCGRLDGQAAMPEAFVVLTDVAGS